MSSVLRTCLVPVVLLLVGVALAGCNGTIAALEPALRSADSGDGEADGRRMIGKPYRVGGRWFHPREDEDYEETGLASWYGPKFHGNQTANGERFDQHALTAAHPTLPLPSYVRVTVLDSGKSAVLRLNDRGPFKRGRIIDVSKAAAKKLGFKSRGMTKVRVEYLGPAEIGGGDRETRMAAAKFGESGEPRRSLRDFLPFGGGGEDEKDAKEAEVRLASAEAPRGGTPSGSRVASAPVRQSASRQAAARRPEKAPAAQSRAAPAATPAPTAAAYRAEETVPDESGAIDALITMNSDPKTDEGAAPAAASALPVSAREAGEARIMDAHDLFAAIDDASGGAGELRGAGQ